jgi:hypothetical protein
VVVLVLDSAAVMLTTALPLPAVEVTAAEVATEVEARTGLQHRKQAMELTLDIRYVFGNNHLWCVKALAQS